MAKTKAPNSGRKKGQTTKNLKDEDYTKYVGMVVELIITKSFDNWSIQKYLQNEHGLSYHQCLKVRKLASDAIKDMYKGKAETALNDAIATLEGLLMEARMKGEINNCVSIQKELNKIKGLHIERVEVEGSITIPSLIKIVTVKKEEDGTGA